MARLVSERVPVREDFLDLTTAWRIQREMGEKFEHLDQRCSAVQSPAFLCDCRAVEGEWKLRVQQQRAARDEAAYQHMLAHDDPFGGTFDVQAKLGYGPDL